MREARRKFDKDFREGAVRLVRETGKPIAQVARDLGVNEGVASLACLVDCGAGEERISEGVPADSGEGQAGEDDGRFGVKFVLTVDRRVLGAGFFGAPVQDAGLAEGGEGDGVAAGLLAASS